MRVTQLCRRMGPGVALSVLALVGPAAAGLAAASTVPTDRIGAARYVAAESAAAGPVTLPSILPSPLPSVLPSPLPHILPSPLPSILPSPLPHIVPSPLPSILPSPRPSVAPSPTANPSPAGGPTPGGGSRPSPGARSGHSGGSSGHKRGGAAIVGSSSGGSGSGPGGTTPVANVIKPSPAKGVLNLVSTATVPAVIAVLLLALLVGLLGLTLVTARRDRREARRLARLEQAKSDFLKVASHELRLPLTVLNGYLSMAADFSLGPLPGELSVAMPLMLDKVAQIEHLIEQMLEAARLEDGAMVMDWGRVDLPAAAAEAVNEARIANPGRQIGLELAAGAAPVVGDGIRLKGVMSQLIDNALKYSGSEDPVNCRLSVRARTAHFEVDDQGPGIADEDLGSLFTRFGRIVTPENSHIPGSGLGLFLAREIARLHNGDLTVETHPNRGITARLSVPLEEPTPAGAGFGGRIRVAAGAATAQQP